MSREPESPASPQAYVPFGVGAWAEVFGQLLKAGTFSTLQAVTGAASPARGAAAFAEANHIAVEAALSVAECQCHTLRETWQRLFDLSGEVMRNGVSSASVTQQYEMVRWGAEKFLEDGRQLASILGRLNQQSAVVAKERLVAMLDEIEELSVNWRP